MFKNISKFIGLLAIFTVASILFSTHKVEAATINVTGSCTINDAIDSVNGAADSGSCTSTGVYGTADQINLPAGTITLTGGLTQIINPVVISGAGKSSTIIDANGNFGFSADNFLANFTFQGFKIYGGVGSGIGISNAQDVTVTDVDIENCDTGFFVNNSLHDTISNVYVHDNIAGLGHSGGLSISANAVIDSDVPFIHIYDSKISNNQTVDNMVGLSASIGNHASTSTSLIIQRTSIIDNSSQFSSCMTLSSSSNSETELNIDSVTIANNITQPLSPASDPSPFSPTYGAGFSMNVPRIKAGQNFKNVTVANNSSINHFDDHLSVAGFFGILISPVHNLSMYNTTIVGNTIVQDIPSIFGRAPTIWLIGVILGQQGPTSVAPGGTATNSLIAHNTYNGQPSSCRSDFDGSIANLPGTFDVSPQNLGYNLSDDQTCTGYTYVPNLYDTIQHNVTDNGGPVPTIALLPGSPAIGAGGQVLGISTDARGIARPNTPDVGAYQTVLAANTSNPNFAGVAVPNSGYGMTYKDSSLVPVLVTINLVSITIGYLTIRKIKQYVE